MRRIVFLACAGTLPSEEPRRGDAFEHDLETAALRPALAEAELELVELDWRAPMAAFEHIDAVLLGTAWDYQDHLDEFLSKLEALEELGVAVFNPLDVVRWNADKRYLNELGKRGAAIVPTLWFDSAGRAEVVAAMEQFGTDRVVVKRQVGASAMGQHSFTRDALPDETWSLGHPAMIQPFLPAILDEGEYTFVFIDGAFSHGVCKRAGKDDYRIQSLYGGYEESYSPTPADLAAAEKVLAALPFGDLLYARVDMVRLAPKDDGGALAVMECELIEPYLYPEQAPLLGRRLAAALTNRLAQPFEQALEEV